MADFTLNPSPGGVPSANMPDQTGASRGAIPDRSLGVIAEGIGQAAQTAVGMYNDYNHYQIDQAVRTGYDAANKPYIDTIPGELSGSVSAMQQLQTAYEQGKISDVYYTGQLASMSKKLRAQYPLYENYVDQSIQNITGIRPANAYKNAVQNEFDKQDAEKKATQSKDETWINQHGDSIMRTYPDYFNDPGKYAGRLDEIKGKVYEYEAQSVDIARQTAANALLDSEKKLTVDKASESATQALYFTVSSAISGMSNSTIGQAPDLLKNIQKFASEGGTPEQDQAILGQLTTLRTSLYSQLNKQINTPLSNDPQSRSYAQILGVDATKKQIDMALAPVDQMLELATNKDYGMMTYYSRLINITQDKEMKAVLDASPNLGIANSLAKISPDLATNYINQAGMQEGIFAQLTPELTARIAKGEDTFTSAVDRMMTSRTDAATKAGGINAMIDAAKSTITSGKASPEEFINSVNGIYGVDKSGKSLFSYIKSDEYMQLWKTMYSPDVTDALVKSGNQDLMKVYVTSALESANSIPELSKAAAAIQDVQDWSNIATVQWDPKNATLITLTDVNKVNKSYPGGATGAAVQKAFDAQKVKTGIDAINSINTVFAQIKPILDAEGIPEDQQAPIFKQFIDNLNVNLSDGKKDDFFSWAAKGFDNVANQVTDKMSSADPNQGIANITDFNFNFGDYSTSVADSYTSKVRGAESGGNDNAANPNSSATGRYQIIDSTYNRYAKRLGLTGDKNDPANQEAVMKAYTQDSVDALNSNGLAVTDGNLYLLHFLGQDAGTNVLQEKGTTALSDILPSRVINANPFLSGWTVGDLLNWSNKKMRK